MAQRIGLHARTRRHLRLLRRADEPVPERPLCAWDKRLVVTFCEPGVVGEAVGVRIVVDPVRRTWEVIVRHEGWSPLVLREAARSEPETAAQAQIREGRLRLLHELLTAAAIPA